MSASRPQGSASVLPICEACGQQYRELQSADCKICLDDRQFVPTSTGQRWTNMETLKHSHHNTFEEIEPNLWSIHTEPKFGIGQRALLIKQENGNVLWDCLSLLDEETIERVQRLGGLRSIVISHPHFLGSCISCAEAFDCSVFVNNNDANWITRPCESRLKLWKGEKLELQKDIQLIRLGGHFTGSSILLWSNSTRDGKTIALTSDTIFPTSHSRWCSFMYSFPNLIPLPMSAVRSIQAKVEKLEPFERLYGAFPSSFIGGDAQRAVLDSCARYIFAMGGQYHHNSKKLEAEVALDLIDMWDRCSDVKGIGKQMELDTRIE